MSETRFHGAGPKSSDVRVTRRGTSACHMQALQNPLLPCCEVNRVAADISCGHHVLHYVCRVAELD